MEVLHCWQYPQLLLNWRVTVHKWSHGSIQRRTREFTSTSGQLCIFPCNREGSHLAHQVNAILQSNSIPPLIFSGQSTSLKQITSLFNRESDRHPKNKGKRIKEGYCTEGGHSTHGDCTGSHPEELTNATFKPYLWNFGTFSSPYIYLSLLNWTLLDHIWRLYIPETNQTLSENVPSHVTLVSLYIYVP